MAVLAILFVIVALANIILGTMLSQSKLTHHQVTRVQAYYAALGCANYAYQKLLLNNDVTWPRTPVPYTKSFCSSVGVAPCTYTDNELPASINKIYVTVRQDTAGRPGILQIDAQAVFTNTNLF